MVTDSIGEADLLALTAAVEQESGHPRRSDRPARRLRQCPSADHANMFRNVPGYGATAEVDDHRVLVGNRKLMADEGLT